MTLGVFIDIEGAFDNTSVKSIKRAVESKGIHPVICGWISHMLKHRRIYASVNDEQVGVTAARGCPQGGVLSPLLWCLVVDGLLRQLKEAGYGVTGYADDVAITISGKYPSTVSERMQGAMRLIEKWCDGEGLSINPAKTSLVPFTKKRAPYGIRDIYLYGKN